MAGEKAYFDYLKSVWPTGIQIGNSGDGIGQAVAAGWSVAGLDGVLQGGVLEGAIGKSYSVETWAGAAEMQSYYESAMASLASPKLLIFGHGNVSSTGSDPTAYSGSTPTSQSPAWQGMRYGLTAALMNDGYYFADHGSYDEETTSNQLLVRRIRRSRSRRRLSRSAAVVGRGFAADRGLDQRRLEARVRKRHRPLEPQGKWGEDRQPLGPRESEAHQGESEPDDQ